MAVTLVDINMHKEEISVLVTGAGTRRLAELAALCNDAYSTKVPDSFTKFRLLAVCTLLNYVQL